MLPKRKQRSPKSSLTMSEADVVRSYLAYKLEQAQRAIERAKDSLKMDETNYSYSQKKHWEGVESAILWVIAGLPVHRPGVTNGIPTTSGN